MARAAYTLLVLSGWESDRQEGSDLAMGAIKAAAHYRNCAAARDAGAAPLSAGDPG